MINKKAQGMSISTIILLILGLVILVVLILGFTIGWKNMIPWLGGGNNLATVQQACTLACSKNSQYDFCTVMRDVRDGDRDEFKATCNDLATKPTYTSRQYGISACPGLCTA
ncbi:MAG: hypothetical protein ACP5NZ_03830 [Nanobdellota archaeon]